jgi:hypothetical protein
LSRQCDPADCRCISGGLYRNSGPFTNSASETDAINSGLK